MLNPTGIKPVEYKVLIRVDVVQEKKGVIYLPEMTREKEQVQHDRGLLVDASEAAFTGAAWAGTVPEPGNQVIFERYAGTIINYEPDGGGKRQQYRLCNDKDVVAVITKESKSDGNTKH